MITREDLRHKYAAFSNFELLAIVEDSANYTDLAVAVAREELQKRNLTKTDFDNYKEYQQEEARIYINKYFVEELTIWQKLFFYILWIPILHFPIKQNLAQDGYILKTRQAGYYSICGFILMIAAVFFSAAIGESDWITLIVWLLLFLTPLQFDHYFNKGRLIKKYNAEVARQQKPTSK
jgi:hypothetical protein